VADDRPPDGHVAAQISVLGADGQPLRTRAAAPSARDVRLPLAAAPRADRAELVPPVRAGAAAGGTPLRVPVRFLPTDLVVPRAAACR
jgi:hypothetical protein